MTSRNFSFVAAFAMAAVLGSANAATIYVDIDANGNNDGTSWANAYNDLQDALQSASNGDQIWVADGMYTPTAFNNHGIQAFNLVSGVAVLGGFDGTETSVYERNVRENEVVLTGETNTPNTTQDNLGTIVLAAFVADAVLDGVTVQDAYSAGHGFGAGMFVSGSDVLIRNVTFTNNEATIGGSALSIGNSTVTISQSRFVGNQGGHAGAALLADNSTLTVTDTVFNGNRTVIGAAAVELNFANATFMNATFTANAANGGFAFTGSAITANSGSLEIMNSIVVNGPGMFAAGTPIAMHGGTMSAAHSIIENHAGTVSGPGLMDGDPAFMNPHGDDGIAGTMDDDLRLRPGSMAVDAGAATVVTQRARQSFDVEGNPRISGSSVDLGAIENR